MVTPAEIVRLLSVTTPDLSPRMGIIEKIWSDSETKITGRFMYVAFRDSRPTVDDLITVAHARMINFAIPRRRINEAIAEINAKPGVMDPWVLLATEARDLFMKTKSETGRSGELGELILYMLIEWVLAAPIVACKMYLKTAQQMPVYGTDGVHLGFNGENLIMYCGESKLHSTLASALESIAESISENRASPEKYKNEVRILKANLDLDGLDDAAKNAIKSYFNPYAKESNSLIESYACLAGFNSKLYEKVENYIHDMCEPAFRRIFEDTIESTGRSIVSYLSKRNIHHLRFNYFILPFPSVEVARASFQERLWGPK